MEDKGVKDFLSDMILRAEEVLGKMIYKLTMNNISISETVAMINSVFALVNQWEDNLKDISIEMLNNFPSECSMQVKSSPPANKPEIIKRVSIIEPTVENAEEINPLFVFTEQPLKQYTSGQTGTGYLTYVVPNTTTFYMIDRSESNDKIQQMLCSLQNVTTRLKELPDSNTTVIGVELEGTIFRAVRCKSILSWLFLKLLDVGEVVPYSESMILYQLTKYYEQFAPLAIRCQLVDVIDEPFCGDFSRYLLENMYNTKRFEICSHENCSLRVNLSAVCNENRNPSIPLAQKKPAEPAPKEYKVSEKTITQEQLDILYEEPLNTTNVMKATMGYVPKDDARICPFYNPKIQGCFKGASCRLEHVAKDPDGWTRDKALHKIKIRAQIIEPKIGSMVKLIPTTIINVEEFFGQLDRKEYIEGLSQLQRFMNDPSYVRDFRKMDHTPYTRELVFAFFSSDGQWYRAEVLEYFHDGLIEVFYLDYGNRENVRLENLRMWDDRFDYLPFQAVHCRLGNVSRLREDDARATAALQAQILDRLVLVKVLDIRSYWEVLVYGAEMMDIGQLMVRSNMARKRRPMVISGKNSMVPA